MTLKTANYQNENLTDKAMIATLIAKATDVLAPVWPLKTFIACNPLQGFEDLTFEQAIAKAESYREINRHAEPGCQAVNREMIKWLSAFLDEGQATIAMPNRQQGFYKVFSDLAKFDSHLQTNQQITSWLLDLPESPEQAIFESLARLNISESDSEELIRQSLAALPGWSGFIKWNDNWRNGTNKHNPINLTEYLAVRLIITCALWPNAKVAKANPVNHLTLIPSFAAEQEYRQSLLPKLLDEAKQLNSAKTAKPDAQLFFCIDVRSESYRRALEATGNYQTFGFAGFFGLPVRVKEYGNDDAHDSCPVLLKPCHEICEEPVNEHKAAVKRHDHGRSLLKAPKSYYQALKYNFATPFALAEMLGFWLGLRMLARTFMPSLTAAVKASVKKIIMPEIKSAPVLDQLTFAEQVNYAESILRMMGLTENIASLVVFCAHGSTTNNNAYAAALDCGACGGNHGGANARILAALLNKQDLRAALIEKGLKIPEHTLFIAAQHDTTTDEVELYDVDHFEQYHQQAINKLKQHLLAAKANNALVRCGNFNSLKKAKATDETLTRSYDWAEPRPEWGLARNAAFIIAPRELTKNIDLQGRCFLHSYDWKNDENGKFLQIILTAPMVVAQWINSQYLFSTLDNISYGGGSKVTKNITGKIGIMQGNASDLMHGLPLQSVYAADDQPYHQALRLLTVVYAPRQIISEIIKNNPVLQKLFGKGWVMLACIEPGENKTYLLERNLTWQTAH